MALPAAQVCLRGAGLFTEYYKEPKMTEEVLGA